MNKLSFIAGLAALGSALSASATPITFNFEGLATASGLSSLTETVDGVTMTVTRVGGVTFGVENLSFVLPPADGWGSRSLSPFENSTASPFVFTFSSPVSSFGFQYGDFGQDFDSVAVKGYSGTNGTGAVTFTGTAPWGYGDLSTDPPGTFLNSGPLSQSFTILGGSSDFPNSLYYDNITVNTASAAVTPEPGSLVLMLTGLVAAAGVQLRRRSA